MARWLTTKIHVLVDRQGLPLQLALTAGQQHDSLLAPEPMNGLHNTDMLLADKACDTDGIRNQFLLVFTKSTNAVMAVFQAQRVRLALPLFCRITCAVAGLSSGVCLDPTGRAIDYLPQAKVPKILLRPDGAHLGFA